MLLWDFNGLIKVFPILSVSFTCQTSVFVVYAELPENSKNIISKLVNYAISVTFLAYFLVI